MPTSTTILTVEDALVAQLAAHATLVAQGITPTVTWQPWSTADQVFIGGVDGTSEIPTMKAGRKQRNEDYDIDVVFRAANTGGTSTGGRDAKERCISYFAALDDILADDTTVNSLDILWAVLSTFEMRDVPLPNDSGWGTEIVATVTVSARLT